METLSLLAVNALNGGGGGGGDVTPDGITTEFNAGEELQANAIIKVNALPSSGILDNSLYHVTETVTYTDSGGTERTFTMYKLFHHDVGGWRSYTTISCLTQADYDHLTEAQKADGTNYIVNGGGRVTRMVYGDLDGKPSLNSVEIDGALTLEDINVYSIDEVDDLLAQKVAAEFVDQLPATMESNTWYYSKKFADGTDVPNDNRALYVLDADDVLQYMGVVGQVDLDGYYTKGESDGRYYTKTDSDAKFQEKIVDSTAAALTDSSLVSDLNASAKTNARFSLASLWTWITGKLKTAITSSLTNTDVVSGKAVYDYAVAKTSDANKVYGSSANFDRVTSVGSSSTDTQLPTAKAIYGYAVAKTSDANRVYGSSTNYPVSDTYASTATNQLFTRAGAYNLYTALNALASPKSQLVGIFSRTTNLSTSGAAWKNISLTGSNDVNTNYCALDSAGIMIKKAGIYKFTITVRLADATGPVEWALGVTDHDDDQNGGTWMNSTTRHKLTTTFTEYYAANKRVFPRVIVVNVFPVLQTCNVVVEWLK